MVLLELLMQLFEQFTFGHRHLSTVLLDTFAADSKQFEGDAVQRFLDKRSDLGATATRDAHLQISREIDSLA